MLKITTFPKPKMFTFIFPIFISIIDIKFTHIILEQAANGNWYVEVKKVDVNAPAILIYEVPEIAETYNSEFTKTSNFFNAATAERTKTVRGLVLTVTDVYELSEDAFDGTPVAGKKVTVEAGSQKHKVSEL